VAVSIRGLAGAQWISGAKAVSLPGLSSFAKGLEQDIDAAAAGADRYLPAGGRWAKTAPTSASNTK
jgi:hypothetical protein